MATSVRRSERISSGALAMAGASVTSSPRAKPRAAASSAESGRATKISIANQRAGSGEDRATFPPQQRREPQHAEREQGGFANNPFAQLEISK
jgi:hypothetical protein